MEHTYTDQFLLGLVEFMDWAKWLFLLAFCLTMGDLKFGIAASQSRNEPVKRSRAIRRTLDKVCSYVIWVMMAYTFGQAFSQPFGVDLVPMLILIIIYGVEMESIFVNYFAARGMKIKVNLLAFFARKSELINIERKEEADDEEH
ncbi:MAG: phage holin family protein [Tannerellaceae bacterium]|nr:phage holin family protein [Tannerellaceae bacterium]MCD8041436.1 phage holin family protein [Tannerellaceae bacterium]